MDVIVITDVEFVRAGSDYIPGVWSCNLAGVYQTGKDYRFLREDGTSYIAHAFKHEFHGEIHTTLFISED